MPTDTQIPQSQVAAAPSDYPVPNTVEFRLKNVRASFTDNGATADWLPTLELLSDSGHLIGTYSDQGVKVTAGGDAAVTWFRGVKPSLALPSPLLAGVKFAYTTMDQTTVNAGAGKVLPLAAAYFHTNSPTLWAQAGFNDVVFNAVGRYLCLVSWRISAAGFFATTFPGEMGVNKQPGRPTTFGFDLQFDVASTAAAQMQNYQLQGFTIDGGAYPTGQPLEYRYVNHTAVTLTLDAAVWIFQLDADTTNLT